MVFSLLLIAHATASSDLWNRCVEEGRATPAQAERGRTLQRQVFVNKQIAQAGLDSLAEAAPGCPTVFMVRAGLLHANGLDDAARRDLGRAAALAPWPEVLRADAVASDEGGDPSKLEAAVEANPQDAALRLRFIQTLPPSERTTMLREALDLHPDSQAIAEAAILGLAESGYLLEAVKRGRELLARHPSLRALVDQLDAQFSGPPAPRERRPSEVRTLDDGTEEVIVYSPNVARERLTERLVELGWNQQKSINGGTRYQSLASGKPYVDVFDNGEIHVQESGVVRTAKPDQSVRLGRSGVDLGGGTSAVTFGASAVSKKKLRGERTALMESIWLEVTEWRQARGNVEFQAAVMEDLPDKLAALWENGTPLYGEKVLATPAQRRQAMLDHWSSRGCTEAGESVRKSVSTFLELEVNESETPLTAAEITAAEAADLCGSKLFGE